MPNHFQALVEITESVGAPLVVARDVAHTNVPDSDAAQETTAHASKPGQPQGIAPTLGSIIGAFKSVTTHAYIRGVKKRDWPPFDGKLWRRNYDEHIIRHARSHRQIAEYITPHRGRWEQHTHDWL
jgi:hypothetical protein